jgi:hypothetical protein
MGLISDFSSRDFSKWPERSRQAPDARRYGNWQNEPNEDAKIRRNGRLSAGAIGPHVHMEMITMRLIVFGA